MNWLKDPIDRLACSLARVLETSEYLSVATSPVSGASVIRAAFYHLPYAMHCSDVAVGEAQTVSRELQRQATQF